MPILFCTKTLENASYFYFTILHKVIIQIAKKKESWIFWFVHSKDPLLSFKIVLELQFRQAQLSQLLIEIVWKSLKMCAIKKRRIRNFPAELFTITLVPGGTVLCRGIFLHDLLVWAKLLTKKEHLHFWSHSSSLQREIEKGWKL